MKTAKNISNLGFTLTELTFVIVLIGIIAAASLPTYINITSASRLNATRSIASALASAIHNAHIQWIQQGQPVPSNFPLTASGANVNVLINTTGSNPVPGWPEDAGPTSVGATSSGTATNAKCVDIMMNLLPNPPTAISGACAGSACYFGTVGSGSGLAAVCTYTDQGSPANVITYNMGTGAVVSP